MFQENRKKIVAAPRYFLFFIFVSVLTSGFLLGAGLVRAENSTWRVLDWLQSCDSADNPSTFLCPEDGSACTYPEDCRGGCPCGGCRALPEYQGKKFYTKRAYCMVPTGGGGGGGGETCSPERYVTTGSESQVKSGALGIIGLFKAYSGIDANSRRVQNVGTPTVGSDAATKSYVDQAIAAAGGGGGSGGGSSCGGPTGGYSTDSGSSCYSWGRGGANCHAESGYSCGTVSVSESGRTSYALCFQNPCGGGFRKISNNYGSTCEGLWGTGAQVSSSTIAPQFKGCAPISGYACGTTHSRGGGQNRSAVSYGICVKQ